MNRLRENQPFYRKFIGTSAFYKVALAVTVPIMLQNGVTNFVSLLDNIMVGKLGTEQMTAVAICNQLFFVFNICIFGAVAGAGIFTTQFFGRGDTEGIRATVRYKIIVSAILSLLGYALFLLYGDEMIRLYLNGENYECDVEAAFAYAQDYMAVMLIGLVAFSVTQTYAGTLRETGETIVPMKASFLAVAVNLCFNYLLIFGKLGFPMLGVVGAAIATVMSRFVEAFYIVSWTHRHKQKNPYIVGLYKSLRIPRRLVKDINLKGLPLLFNEALWSFGMAFLAQCFSVRGLEVIAAYNIASVILNFFIVVAMSFGNAIAIMVGHQLGAKRHEEAKDTVRKLIFFSLVCCTVCGGIMALLSGFFTDIYNTTGTIKHMARSFILIIASCLPIIAFVNASYFTLRSGGKTIITFIYDCGYMWLIAAPVTYILTRYTSMPIVLVFAICQYAEITKCIAGYILLKKNVWINSIPNSAEALLQE